MEGPQQAENLEHEIQTLERKSLRVARVSLVVVAVLAAGGLLALLLPSTPPRLFELRASGENARYALSAFLFLALVFSLYTFRQQRLWGRTRGWLTRELTRRDAMEKLLLMDPLTETYNRRALEEVLQREVSRVERYDTSLTFLKIEVENLEDLTTRSGGEVGERIVKQVALLLKRGLRPTDILVRYDTSEFLIVMSETSQYGALAAVRRVLERVEELNLMNSDVPGHPIKLNYGLAAYTKGVDVRDVLAAADHSIRLYRERI